MRTTVKLASVLALVLAGQAFALSTVAYVVELGGDPGVAGYEAYTYPQYVRGSGADGATVAVDGSVNWGVVATVSGVHSGAVGDGQVPAGIANAVFTLVLKDNAGNTITTLGNAPLVSNVPQTAGWYSLINDGDADGVRGGLAGADPLQNAAFPSVFNIGGNGANGGRLFDTKASGGPYMNFFHYPSATGLAVNVNGNMVMPVGCNGALVGMGAGYSAFLPLAASPNTGGVGLTGTSGNCTGLGEKVLFEGQLSLKGLATGTYKLAVTGGAGTNIIPYASNRCGLGSPAAFAAVPNAMTGDEIIFQIAGAPCNPLSIVGAVSVKTHGTNGTYERASGTIEGRSNGPTKILTTFNQNVQLLSGNASVSLSSGTVSSVTVAGAVVTINCTGVATQAILTVGYPGVAAACSAAQTTSATKCWKVLMGDANGSSPVNSLDILAERGVLNQQASASNFTKDVNASGKIDSLDILYTRGKLNQAVSGVCNP